MKTIIVFTILTHPNKSRKVIIFFAEKKVIIQNF